MEGGKKDFEKLRLNAVKYGASKAAMILARDVVVDPRVRLKCMIPVCAGYGVNLMCPPNVMTPEEF
jgi:predicted metal-binding protein